MEWFSRLVFTLLLCAPCASLFAADDYPRNAALDAINYRLSLTIKDASDEIQAEAEILFEFKKDGVKTMSTKISAKRSSHMRAASSASHFRETTVAATVAGLRSNTTGGRRTD